MRLGLYLKRCGITQDEFAEKMGVEQATVSRWVTGRATPDLFTVRRIRKATRGRVSYEDWPDE